MTNLRLAVRTLLKSPLVTLVAIVSLALGVGANSAIFSLYNQMLLRPLPVAEPDRLVNLSAPGPKPGSNSCNQAGDCTEVFSYPMYRDLVHDQQAFTGIAAHRLFGANLGYRGETLNGEGVMVSGSYFPVLGLQPALGRLLNESDAEAVGGSPVVVLNHTYWRTRFEESPSVLNETLTVNGQALTIVGVAPRGFDGTTVGSRPQVFVPVTLRAQLEPYFKDFENRSSYWMYLFARLKPGVTLEQAATAINVPYRAIINDVEAPLQKGMSDRTLERFRARTIGVAPGARGQSSVQAEARMPLLLLLAVTAIVIIIACANIANLLLARSAPRATEMAVRLSIGAGRWQLVRQLLLESCLLALLGGVFGLVVAHWTLRGVAALLPPEAIATLEFQLDPTVMLVTAVIALATGLAFGIVPALHATRPDLAATLKGQAGQPSGARSAARFRTSLIAVQIALSMMLLVTAGLFVRSLVNVSRVELGLNVDNLVVFGLSPSLNGYAPEASLALFERAERELAAIPGVTGVTAALVPLLSGSNWGSSVRVEGFDAGPDTDVNARFNQIGAGYFRTLGIPVQSGREFTESDAAGTAKVAIVNEAFTKKFGLGRDAVGKRMRTGRGEGPLDTEIVGVVRNAKYSDVKDEIPPQFFRPYRQDEQLGFMNFYVRTAVDPESVMPTIAGVMKRLDANLPVENLKTMPQQVRENVFLDRLISTLSTSFALVATLLAAIGLYGVLAYTVSQRTREFGLRMALGADAANVRRLVLRQVALLAIVGGTVGLAAAIGLGRLARSLLFEMAEYDPLVIAGSIIALTLVAFAAGIVPALRASRIDPMRALRYE